LPVGSSWPELARAEATLKLSNPQLGAAEKLQSVLDGRERGTDVLEMRVEMGRIMKAVRSVVPQSMWGEILSELDEAEQHPEALDVGADAYGDADDAYDPTEFIEEDDEL
jgi:hypothetical protein